MVNITLQRLTIKTTLTKQQPTCNLTMPISLIIISNILQSSQRAITPHSHIVKNLKNIENPSIPEPPFGSYNREYIMDGEKRIIHAGKMLKWRFGRDFPSKILKMWSFTTNREELHIGKMLG
jgi:hypothetical protein